MRLPCKPKSGATPLPDSSVYINEDLKMFHLSYHHLPNGLNQQVEI